MVFSLPRVLHSSFGEEKQMSTRPGIGTKYAWLLLIDTNMLWAGSYVASKVALRELLVTMMLALRFGLAALLLLPWLVRRRKDLRLTRQDLLQLGVLVLVGFGISKLLQFGGLVFTTASDVGLLIGSESFFTAALSWLLLKERLKGRTMVALLLGFFGVYLIVEQGLVNSNIQRAESVDGTCSASGPEQRLLGTGAACFG
jgi:drug/metabolite transporter (DMT)-like permease